MMKDFGISEREGKDFRPRRPLSNAVQVCQTQPRTRQNDFDTIQAKEGLPQERHDFDFERGDFAKKSFVRFLLRDESGSLRLCH